MLFFFTGMLEVIGPLVLFDVVRPLGLFYYLIVLIYVDFAGWGATPMTAWVQHLRSTSFTMTCPRSPILRENLSTSSTQI